MPQEEKGLSEEERRQLDGLFPFFADGASKKERSGSRRVIRYFQSRGWLAKKSGPLEIPKREDGSPGTLPRAGRADATLPGLKGSATGESTDEPMGA